MIAVILGNSIPLFPQGTGELKLRFVAPETRVKGFLHLVCERLD